MTLVRSRRHAHPVPLVPQSVCGWLFPHGRLPLAGFILAGGSLVYVIGRHAQLLAEIAQRH